MRLSMFKEFTRTAVPNNIARSFIEVVDLSRLGAPLVACQAIPEESFILVRGFPTSWAEPQDWH